MGLSSEPELDGPKHHRTILRVAWMIAAVALAVAATTTIPNSGLSGVVANTCGISALIGVSATKPGLSDIKRSSLIFCASLLALLAGAGLLVSRL